MSQDNNQEGGEKEYQSRVNDWMQECFGAEISKDKQERNHRFLEEALELVQSCGASESECNQLVQYVFSRAVGEKVQEVGGVMVTLAALCLAQDLDMMEAGETELKRIWTKVDKIRAKQAAKPKHSPLPAPTPSPKVEDAAKEYEVIRITGVATGVGFKEKLKDGSGFFSENICSTLYDSGNDKKDSAESEKWAIKICDALNAQSRIAELEAKVGNIKCQCKDRKGETSVMCCNDCGLPTEDFWDNGFVPKDYETEIAQLKAEVTRLNEQIAYMGTRHGRADGDL